MGRSARLRGRQGDASHLSEEQFPPVETQHALRRMAESRKRIFPASPTELSARKRTATVRLLAWLPRCEI